MTELSPLAWRLRRCLLSLDRDRIQLAEVWSCLLGAAPHLVDAPDRRHLLRHALDELAAANWLALPDDPNGYDRRDPRLPRSVDVLPASERARRLGVARAEAWHQQLAWAADVDLNTGELTALRRINTWLVDNSGSAVIVPPRERSLELFGTGNRDRLHELAATELFGPHRLSWELLSCAPVPPPFVWSPVGPGATLVVVSGHETFASVRRVLVEAPSTGVGIVAHGAGVHFANAVTFARTLDRAIERILYYGDIDADDLHTAQRANRRASAADLPMVEPATAMYELLVTHGIPSSATPLPVERARQLAAWLPTSVRDDVARLLVNGLCLVQEWVGYRLLLRERIWESLGVP